MTQIWLPDYIFEFLIWVLPIFYLYKQKITLMPLTDDNLRSWLKNIIFQMYGNDIELLEEKNDDPNVFLYRVKKSNVLVFTTGFLKRSNELDRFKAAVSHELGHLVNGDVQLTLRLRFLKKAFEIFFIVYLGYLLTIISFWVFTLINKNRIFLASSQIFLQFSIVLIYLFFFNVAVNFTLRSREYLADVTASTNFDAKNCIIEILGKLPEKSGKISQLFNLFSNYPSNADRIKNIRENNNRNKYIVLFLFSATLGLTVLASLDLLISIILSFFPSQIFIQNYESVLYFYYAYMIFIPSILIFASFSEISIKSRLVFVGVGHLFYSLIILVYFFVTYLIEIFRRINHISLLIPSIARFSDVWSEYLTWSRDLFSINYIKYKIYIFLYSFKFDTLFISGVSSWILFSILLFATMLSLEIVFLFKNLLKKKL
jgi:Zn-dependent protease with chaperone function